MLKLPTVRELAQIFPESSKSVQIEKDGNYSLRYWKECLDETVAMWATINGRLTEVHLL